MTSLRVARAWWALSFGRPPNEWRTAPQPWCVGARASKPSLSRPAQALLALRPVGSLNRPSRPLSRGFDPAGYPATLLVSYQTNHNYLGETCLHWCYAPSGAPTGATTEIDTHHNYSLTL